MSTILKIQQDRQSELYKIVFLILITNKIEEFMRKINAKERKKTTFSLKLPE